MAREAALQQPGYSIGVVSRLTGISVHTLRMWERRYGLGASRRSAGGQREYTQVDLDHLQLIKQLLDVGLKIGDIARLPRKTLSGLMREHAPVSAKPEASVYRVAVISPLLAHFFRDHSRRYPRLAVAFPDVSPAQWLQQPTGEVDLAFLQVDSLHRADLEPIRRLRKQGTTVFIHYQFSRSAVVEELENAGVRLSRGGLDQRRIDELVQQGIRQQDYSSALHRNADRFDLPLPQTRRPLFSEQQLVEASLQTHHLQCECPSHLAELIMALNAFEQYSSQCEADNWQDAAVHACVYSYTAQARSLMERALQAILEQDA